MKIGPVEIPGRVWLAPMTGVSDLPYRLTAAALGACYVATEMVAGELLAAGRPDQIRRAAVGEGLPLMAVQLVGRDPRWIAMAARMAEKAGAHIIDLNFGCPAKAVTGVLCGSAVMRDLKLAERLVRAAAEAVAAPVTVKMRLGWDEASRNAPELAARAEAAGAKGFTVHARTREAFYGGVARWSEVAAVKATVRAPVIVNGDIIDCATARRALAASGADAVMVGRAAVGAPWLAAKIDAELAGRAVSWPTLGRWKQIVLAHFTQSVGFYGEALGVRMFRKHLAAYLDRASWMGSPQARREARSRLCRLDSPAEVEHTLRRLWGGDLRLAA